MFNKKNRFPLEYNLFQYDLSFPWKICFCCWLLCVTPLDQWKITKTSSCYCCGWLRWCVHFPHLHGKPRELRSEKLKRENAGTVQICNGVFLLPNRCFFMHLLLDYFWEIEISWMGLYDTWIYPTNGWRQKKSYIIYQKKNIMGRASSQNISSKETLCFIGPSTGLESGVKYAEVPSTSSLRCCLTATITSRRGWWGPLDTCCRWRQPLLTETLSLS